MTTSDVLHYKLDRTVLLSAYAASLQIGAASILTRDASGQWNVDKALDTFQKQLKSKASLWELKLVGPPQALEEIEELLRSKNLLVKSKAKREDPGIEVFFACSTGKLKVSADADTASVHTTPTPALQRIQPDATSASKKRIRVLIVDDSTTIRSMLTTILSSDPLLDIVGTASHPREVEGLITRLKPDVLTLDIHMPDMDGVTLLKQLMPRFKVPTIMITSVSMEEGPLVLDALEAGAVDYIQKPTMASLAEVAPQIIDRVKTASQAKLVRHGSSNARPHGKTLARDIDQNKIIAIGSSTGGTEALREIFVRLPDKIPPIVVVQHIPPVFSKAFANRLNELCPFHVKEAEQGDSVLPNQVLIAPGGKHMRLVKASGAFKVVLEETEHRNRHRPSVDVLFESVATLVKDKAVGVILTGMGGDGAEGLLKMLHAGAKTIAQNEESCVVFGMPRRAIEINAAESILELSEIAEKMMSLVARK